MPKLYSNFPTIPFMYKQGNEIKQIQLKDICIKFSFSNDAIIDGSAFYPYTLTDEYRVETLSNIYYKSPYDYWLFLMSNQMFDIHNDLPIPESIFNEVMYRKYKEDAISAGYDDTINSVVEYMNQTTYQFYDGDGYVIDEDDWTVETSPDKYFISIYEFEAEQNNNKREILMIDKKYKYDVYRDLENKLERING